MTDANRPSKRITQKQEALSPDTLPARLAALAKLPDEAVQRAVANNPRTPPKALKKLGSSRDKYTRKAVAGNPNTPADIMSGLGGQFPMELLGNPALDLLLLENPDLFSEMPIGTLRSLAKREDCPEGLLSYMARAHQDENLQRSLVQNPDTPRKVIEQLIESGELEEIKEEARLHVTLSSELDAKHAETLFWESVANQVKCSTPLHWQLLSDAKVPEWFHDGMVAKQVLWGTNGSDARTIQKNFLPIPILESLAANGRIKIRRAACNNTAAQEWLREAKFRQPILKGIEMRAEESFTRLSELYGNSTPEFDIIMAEHPLATDEMKRRRRLPEFRDKQMWVKAASSPFAWDELLWHLAEIGDVHSGLDTRIAIAANPKTPITLLEKLADKEENYRVKGKLAKNSRTPAAVLEKLASDKYYWTRQKVAKNPNTNPATLEMLAGDADYDVRYRVAENLNTPASTLERLAGDEGVSKFTWQLIRIREVVANNPNTLASALEKLASDENDRVRGCVAENPNTPASTLEKLASDKDDRVRKYVAENLNTPAAAMEKLASDESYEVRRCFAKNINAYIEPVNHPRAIAKNPDTPIAILESLAGDKNVQIRRYVADNPSTPASVLEKLAEDGHEVVRWDVASNTNTPTLTLEILANDAVTRVRRTARDTLRRRQLSSVKN